jgi:hypothetical protein
MKEIDVADTVMASANNALKYDLCFTLKSNDATDCTTDLSVPH